MDNKKRLITLYGDKVKPKKSFYEMGNYLIKNLDAQMVDFSLVLDPMRNFLIYNIKMYAQTHKIDVNIDSLDIILYIIPKDGKGKKYYKENYTLTSISGYKDYIYIIVIEQLEYYMESNCGVLFVDMAIERGISDQDAKERSIMYIEYLSRIEAKENNYYKNGIKLEKL